MLSFKEFVLIQEGKLARSIAIAGAGALALGASIGAKVGDHHNRVKHIEKVTKAAIDNPFHDKHSSELSPYAMGDFLKATDVPKDDETAKMKSDRQEGNKARIRNIPIPKDNQVDSTFKQGFQSYKAGRFSINSEPHEADNPWYNKTKTSK